MPESKQPWRLKIGEIDSPLSVQADGDEQKKLPATLKILQSRFLDEFPSGSIPTRVGKDCEGTLKPVSGKFLELTIKLTAQAPYAENSEGLYKNNRVPFHDQNIGISFQGAGYVPAVAAVLDGKAYVGGGTDVDPANKDGADFTFLFPVPGKISTLSVLYNRVVVLQDAKLEP